MARIFIVTMFLFVAFGLPAAAERHALVIGNAHYDALSDLDNTLHDAEAYHETLSQLGYNSVLHKNLDIDATETALDTLLNTVNAGDEVVFVYSGHGWSDGNINFISPTDSPQVASDRARRRASVAIRDGRNGVLDALEAANVRLTVAIIDACRNTPFQAPAGTKSSGLTRGLAPMSLPQGTFVVFSAGIGQMSLDRLPNDPEDQRLSVFTRNFLPHLKSGAYLEDAISDAQVATYEMALTYDGHQQQPAYYDETRGKTCLGETCQTGGAAGVVAQQVDPCSVARNDWGLVLESSDANLLNSFAKTHEGCALYAALAKTKLSVLTSDGAAPASLLAQCKDAMAVPRDHVGSYRYLPEATKRQVIEVCRQAARSPNHGDQALAPLAWALFESKSYEDAFPVALKAAELGDISVAFPLHFMRLLGWGVEQNTERAMHWLDVGVSAGDATTKLAKVNTAGNSKLSHEEFEQVRFLLEELIAEGHTNAIVQLANWYQYVPEVLNGHWTANPEQAMRLLLRAAEAGNVVAMENLGYFHSRNPDVWESCSESFEWAVRAANAGSVFAMDHVFRFLANGFCSERDVDTAANWAIRGSIHNPRFSDHLFQQADHDAIIAIQHKLIERGHFKGEPDGQPEVTIRALRELGQATLDATLDTTLAATK